MGRNNATCLERKRVVSCAMNNISAPVFVAMMRDIAIIVAVIVYCVDQL